MQMLSEVGIWLLELIHNVGVTSRSRSVAGVIDVVLLESTGSILLVFEDFGKNSFRLDVSAFRVAASLE